MPPPPPRRSLFARLESGSFDELTHEDELRGGLVAMVAASAQQTRVATARTHNEAEPEPSAAAASDETTTAAASMPAVAAPSGVDCSSPHLFSLLARYPSECNRISRYLQLDSSALWDAVKRQSRFALHSAEAVTRQAHTRNRAISSVLRPVLTGLSPCATRCVRCVVRIAWIAIPFYLNAAIPRRACDWCSPSCDRSRGR